MSWIDYEGYLMLHLNHQTSLAELRKFGLVTAGMLVLYFDLLIPWILSIAPASLRHVYKVLMQIAEVLGWINTRIILFLTLFLLFLPFGLILRQFYDPM